MRPEDKFKTVNQLKMGFKELNSNPENFSIEDIEYLERKREEFADIFAPIAEEIQKKINHFENLVSKIAKAIRRDFNISIDAQKRLAKSNWYLPFWELDQNFFNELSSCISINEIDMIDQKMLEYYKSEFERLSHEIIEKIPERSLPLKQAFEANKQGWFYLSIPVYFAQIEGIFEEITGVRLFSIRIRENGDQELRHKRKIEDIYKSEMMQEVLAPILHVRDSNRIQIKNNPSGLNRHDVMHGNSFDYGNEINSYKIFSLLVYIIKVIKDKSYSKF